MANQMWSGGFNSFNEMTGEYSGGYTPPKLSQPTYPDGFQGQPVIDDFSPTPAGDKWSSFNNMLNTAPMNGQKGWPSPDRKANPWMLAQRAMANQNRQAAQANNSFRQLGDYMGRVNGITNPLGMRMPTEPVAPVSSPKVRDVPSAASQIQAHTAPVADLPTAVAQAPKPYVPATITPSSVSAPNPNMITGTLWNQMADPANYLNNSVMSAVKSGIHNYRGKIY